MFQWATQQFEKISQTVAPPPTDAAGRFALACQRQEEETAMGCIAEIDPLSTVVNQVKGYFPIHLACQFSMTRLIQLLMQQPGMNIEQPDYGGNTPLHHACMSSQRGQALVVVKMLLNDYGASVLAKNSLGQTPYDVASLDSVRQYLLPIQLQKETQIALDNGGQGLPPGIDLGGLRINNSAMPPPPKFGEGGIPPPTTVAANMMASPSQQRYAATPIVTSQPPAVVPQNQYQQPIVTPIVPAPASGPYGPSPVSAQPAPAVSGSTAPVTPPAIPAASRTRSAATTSTGSVASTESGYSRTGGSSAAVFSTKYRADGFHSSSSDVSLQKKYGHVNANNTAMPPPPSSGNAAPLSGGIPSVPGTNPFGGGFRPGSRYLAYGPVAAPASGPSYGSVYGNTAAPAPQYFTPGAAAPTPTMAAQPVVTSPATPTTPFMPPPPYQTQNYAAPVSSPPPAVVTSTAAAAAVLTTPGPSTPASAVAAVFETPHPTTASSIANATTTSTAETVASVFEQPPETQQQQQQEATSESSPDALATTSSDWVETVDPSSGKSYYYNAKTNETSWTKPAETISSGSENVSQSEWTEATDPSSGKTYYYNTKTGETSWENPSAAESPGAADDATTTPPSSEENERTATEETIAQEEERQVETKTTPTSEVVTETENVSEQENEEPKQEQQLQEEVSNELVVEPQVRPETTASEQMKEEQTEDIPEKKNVQEEQAETHHVMETSAEDKIEEEEESIVKSEEPEQTPAAVSSEENTDLPEHWVEVPDPSSGKSYYYNIKTQETSWERPTKASNEGDSAMLVDTLAEGWVEVQDPNSGKSYYFNQTTNETSWEKPLARSMGAAVEDDGSDWVETVDPSSGRSYYYNSKSGETSWEKPPVLTAVESNHPAPAGATTESPVDEKPPAIPQPQEIERQKSAEELFSDGPPDAIDQKPVATPQALTSTLPDFVSPAAATFGSPETPALSVATTEGGFGSPSVDTPASTEQSAEAVFEAGPSVSGEPVAEQTATLAEPVKEQSNGLNDSNDTESEMMDIPLSPEPVSMVVPEVVSKLTEVSSPSNDATVTATNDLFAAIGMPPPPFQSKR
ncbi:WW domain containing protein [Nitzschia inconspicua]|uniref:WW domain containing protein n=1 Tax=Nitzschia inconspicua TaxID=303405 RepID=A0A9K3LFG2_9STRA|nr:WW domain containing protein [Nitzschia inconspicua]